MRNIRAVNVLSVLSAELNTIMNNSDKYDILQEQLKVLRKDYRDKLKILSNQVENTAASQRKGDEYFIQLGLLAEAVVFAKIGMRNTMDRMEELIISGE